MFFTIFFSVVIILILGIWFGTAIIWVISNLNQHFTIHTRFWDFSVPYLSETTNYLIEGKPFLTSAPFKFSGDLARVAENAFLQYWAIENTSLKLASRTSNEDSYNLIKIQVMPEEETYAGQARFIPDLRCWVIYINAKYIFNEKLDLILAHEIGHCLGFSHRCNRKNIMYPRVGSRYYGYTEFDKRSVKIYFPEKETLWTKFRSRFFIQVNRVCGHTRYLI